ncbi:sulfotransferase [Desulfobacula sp.]|uniref:sulfotransferase n=1 Tax=Desulfobacula sp. TaxID=2593537 RepID=UPI0027144AD5|nr:sulfotransferase [Desulfobacula sp.]
MHKYLNPKNYLRYFLNRFAGLASIALQPVENYLGQKYGDKGIKNYPPVFIIGAPRCGSTLLYKILTERFKFSYFSNFTAKFYKIPICGTLLQKILGIRVRTGGYNFNYGQVEGLGSPNECGEFWYRWFPRGMHIYVAPDQIPAVNLKELRAEIGGISAVTKRPVIFKNLYNSMRIAPIVEAMPEAVFIVCKRDYLNNALSILKGREIHMGDKKKWMGTPPKEIDKLLDLSNEKQVVGQVYYIYQQIKEDLIRFGKQRFYEVSYEKFCSDIHSSVELIENFLLSEGCSLEKRDKIPKRFQAMGVDGIHPDDRKMVAKAVQNLIRPNNK